MPFYRFRFAQCDLIFRSADSSYSQGDVAIFDQVFHEVEDALLLDRKNLCTNFQMDSMDEKASIRKALLDVQDRYGNTLLHVAAWNDKTALYDRLIQLGADAGINNSDGLTPFTLTARLGIWNTFNHIWDRHLTQTVWMFGNVERRASDYTFFDWKGIKTFVTRAEVQSCMVALVAIYVEYGKKVDLKELFQSRSMPKTPNSNEAYTSLLYKHRIVEQKAEDWSRAKDCKELRSKIVDWLHRGEMNSKSGKGNAEDDDEIFDQHEEDAEQRSAIRMITLFRPDGWYKHTKDKLEGVILRKWSDGYHLVHLGQGLLPYCMLLLIFGMMWWKRELHVLQHNLWWATPEATAGLSGLPHHEVLRNPVVANIPELLRLTEASVTGTEAFRNGRLPPEIFGEESTCGWRAIRDSISGRLQAVQVLYGVICLIRLAFTQRRVRPSDWDENEDMIITTDETINFVYLNLEVLLHIIMCGLYITIGVARVSAGEECSDYFVRIEKNSTAIAALFLFINLITVCKPYEGIGLLVLTTYKFLVSDVFNFILMYCTLFAGFLLTLQTLHNSNRVYLAWLDASHSIFPQVKAVTEGATYLVNSNTPEGAERLLDTQTAMNGCAGFKWPIYATAMTLLEISFGDGLADALQQARQSDYACAGFKPDPLTAYILIFWVFLTNVLILNMLIAMMNYTFDRQKKNVHSVWLLDVSYRIMRYERLFPELIDRMQSRRTPYSFWRLKFWNQLFMDACLVIYCFPEIHVWGLSHALYVSVLRIFTRSGEPSILNEILPDRLERGNAEEKFTLEFYKITVRGLVELVDRKRFEDELAAENAARKRADVKEVKQEDRKRGFLHGMRKSVKVAKGHMTDEKLIAVSMLPDVVREVAEWREIVPANCFQVLDQQHVQALSNNAPAVQHASGDGQFLPQQAHGTLVLPQELQLLPQPIPAEVIPSQPSTGHALAPVLPLVDKDGLPCSVDNQFSKLASEEESKLEEDCKPEDHSKPLIDWKRNKVELRDELLLVISLICRLDMLQQDFRESCTVLTTHTRQQAGAGAAAAAKGDDSDDDSVAKG